MQLLQRNILLEIIMTAVPKELLEQQKAAVNSIVAAQNTLFGGFEKLVDLNLKVIRATLGDVAQTSQQVTEAKDPQELVSLVGALAQPAAEKVVAYSRDVYEIVSQVSGDLLKLSETQMTEVQRQLSESVDQFAKNAPTGSESAVAFLKSTLATVNNAYDSLNKATKQVVETAENNMAVATEQASKVTRVARKQS